MKKEVTEEWRKSDNEELHEHTFSSGSGRVNKDDESGGWWNM
jgi:hypothetical protein